LPERITRADGRPSRADGMRVQHVEEQRHDF
jgi:hypothetical protein